MALLIFLVSIIFDAYIIVVLVRAVLPWFPKAARSPAFKFIYVLTDPVLLPLKRALPPLRIGFDPSPAIAIILLWLLQQIIIALLISL